MSEAAAAARAATAAEASLVKAEAEVKAAEVASGAARPEDSAQAEAGKALVQAKVDAARAQLDKVKAEAQAKADVLAQAQNEIKAADAALAAALQASDEAKQKLVPVSVFISRKTQRLYVRQNNEPVFEAPVIFRDAGKPIGSFVYTALDNDGPSGAMRWSLVSMYKNATNIEPFSKSKDSSKGRHSPAEPADVASANAALERLTLTPEAIERISQVLLPGSSLIVSDEGPSIETGKDTDFVVFMSGEPQGGIAIRSHHHEGLAKREGGWFDDDDGPSRSRSRGGGWGFPF
jgi:multidrug efflux pump subunit AcrA (membrane-fusion protein)